MQALVEALQAGWSRVRGSLVYSDPDIEGSIQAARVTKLVKTPVRGEAAWREVYANLTNDGEIFADGPRSEHDDFARDFAQWKRQGWYPRATMVDGARLTLHHKPSDKTFMAEFQSEAEAQEKADEAIPKLRERRRPSWLQIYEGVETPEQMIKNVGPPGEWSGSIASILGPERRKAIKDFWAAADAATKERLQAAFEKNFAEATLAGSVATLPTPFAMISRDGRRRGRWRKRGAERSVEEGITYDVGTVRRRKRGEFIKVSGDPPEWEAFAPSTNPLGALAASLKTGRVVGTMEQHAAEAAAEIGKHEAGFGAFRSGLKAAIPVDFTLNSRVKKADSALGKLARKPGEYPNAKALTDLTGAEIVVKSGADASAALSGLRKNYGIVEEDDMVARPRKEGYRAIHALIRDRDGLVKEVQIMTERQKAWKAWFHDIYKPTSKDKERALAPIMQDAAVYGKALSDHLARLDSGAQSTAPECPKAIEAAAGRGPTA